MQDSYWGRKEFLETVYDRSVSVSTELANSNLIVKLNVPQSVIICYHSVWLHF